LELTMTEAVICQKGEGGRRWFYGGGIHTWKVTSEQSDGAFLLFEDDLVAGKCTPLHQHPDADETFLMLEGEIVVHLACEERAVGPGGIAMIPRGVPHAFLVTSPTARMLCLQTPGSCQGFFFAASQLLDDSETTGPVDMDKVMTAAQQQGGMVPLGPPPFAPR
jgi:quercetin dioxygenase-like cupin family protein